MNKSNVKELQLSALSRINFCFFELKKNPPLSWENNILDNESMDNTKNNYFSLNANQQELFNVQLFNYLDRESTTESRIMLLINYLEALLIKGKNNNISIHKSFENYNSEIEEFENQNRDLLNRIKTARDKLYAHIDLDWSSYAKGITFEELEICINFLNKLFNYDFNVLTKFDIKLELDK